MTQRELGDFYERHVAQIYRYFFYRVLERELAEDLTSQCFLKFAKQGNDRRVLDAKKFLYGIARHVFLDHLRKKYKQNEYPLIADEVDEDIQTSVEAQESIDFREKLESSIEELPPQQRAILQLRFIERLSISEVAEKLGKDRNYVSTTQRRAVISLRKSIQCTVPSTNITEEKEII